VKLAQHRGFKAAAFALILALLAFIIGGQYLRSHRPPPPLNSAIPMARVASAAGLVVYDTHGRVPGDPQNGVNGLKRMYQLILEYRRKNGGRYPTDEKALFLNIIRSPQAYGFRDIKDFLAKMNNPDSRFSDSEGLRRAPGAIPYSFSITRFDGTKIGTPKAAGTRDVLGQTGLYYHQNEVIYPSRPFTMKPVGFYEVLWDDGSVEKIPYDKTLQVPVNDPTVSQTRKKYHLSPGTPVLSTRLGFPGQAGLPPGTLSFKDFYTKFAPK